MLTIDDPAPAITAEAIGQGRVDLAELRRHGPVLVKFHRFSGCPVAQRQIGRLLEEHRELADAGIATIVVLHNSPGKLGSAFRTAPGVHIVADRDKHLYREYGAGFRWRAMLAPGTWAATLRSLVAGYLPRPSRFEGGVVGVPADFLVGGDGRIVALHYGRHYGDSWTVADVLAAADDA